MTNLEAKLRALSALDCAAQGAAIEAALRRCDPAEQRILWRRLVEVVEHSTRAGPLAAMLNRLCGDLAALAVRSAVRASLDVSFDDATALARLPGVARVAGAMMTSAQPGERRAAAALAGQAPLATIAVGLVSLLVDEQKSVADAAEQAIARLSQTVPAPWSARTAPEGGAGVFFRALNAATARFAEHRRIGVLAGLVSFAARGGPSPAVEADHPATLVLRRLLRQREPAGATEIADDSTPSAAALDICAWRWLKNPVLAAACVERLRERASVRVAGAGAAHLLAHPARVLSVAKVSIASDTSGGAGPVAFPAMLVAMSGRAREKDAALSELLSGPDVLIRHALARSAAQMPTRPSCLLDLCFDAHPAVARTAAIAVLSQPQRGLVQDGLRERTLSALARSVHPGVAAVVRTESRLRPNGACTPTYQSVAEIMDAVEQGLHHGADERELAGLVTRLGTFDDDDSRGVLTRLLCSAPARVRANAVDALVRRARKAGESGGERGATFTVLPVLRDDGEHRVRACAARGLLLLGADQASGHATVLTMLADGRPMHRVAALWLTERLAPRLAHRPEVIDAVAQVVRSRGALPAEHAWRAERTARRLMSEIRVTWRARTAETNDDALRTEAAA